MMGKIHQLVLVVMINRSSLKTELIKVKSRKSPEFKKAIKKAMAPYRDVIRTISFDNDKAIYQPG